MANSNYPARSANTAGARFLQAVADEWKRATVKHAPMNSAHEAYAVILEELDEFWEEVRKQASQRSAGAMYDELVQVAAMAMRCATDVVDHMPEFRVQPGGPSLTEMREMGVDPSRG